MPPKAKLTREEIANAGFALLRRGADVTARSLAAELNCSPRPLFTVYSSMKEIMDASVRVAVELYNSYVEEGLKEKIPFKGSGKAYMRFAREEPALFRLLFMTAQSNPVPFDRALEEFDESYEKILAAITVYGVTREGADRLYKHLWIYTHGIASMMATGVISFTDDEIDELLTEVFVPLLKAGKERERG